MNSALIVSVVSSLVTMVFMYLDTKVFDNPKTKFTYFKNVVLVFAISYSIVYFMGNPNISQVGGSVLSTLPIATALSPSSTSLVADINQEIMTGMPNF